MGVGQQLNVSNDQYLAPLDALGGRRVSVVGFDLEELATSGDLRVPRSSDRVVADLVRLAGEGVVLSASWHANNPRTGGKNYDRAWHDLGALLDRVDSASTRSSGPTSTPRWRSCEQLQAAGAAVVFRPAPRGERRLVLVGPPGPGDVQDGSGRRCRSAPRRRRPQHRLGLHLQRRDLVRDPGPGPLLPGGVDLAGIDTYDAEVGAENAKDRLPMAGYAAVAAQGEADDDDRGRPARQQVRRLEPRRHHAARRGHLKSRRSGRCSGSTTLATKKLRYLRQISSLEGGPPGSTPAASATARLD